MDHQPIPSTDTEWRTSAKRCREILILPGGNGEPELCDAVIEQFEVKKPYAPFTAEQNHGQPESPNWTINYCPQCHTSHLLD